MNEELYHYLMESEWSNIVLMTVGIASILTIAFVFFTPTPGAIVENLLVYGAIVLGTWFIYVRIASNEFKKKKHLEDAELLKSLFLGKLEGENARVTISAPDRWLVETADGALYLLRITSIEKLRGASKSGAQIINARDSPEGAV